MLENRVSFMLLSQCPIIRLGCMKSLILNDVHSQMLRMKPFDFWQRKELFYQIMNAIDSSPFIKRANFKKLCIKQSWKSFLQMGIGIPLKDMCLGQFIHMQQSHLRKEICILEKKIIKYNTQNIYCF